MLIYDEFISESDKIQIENDLGERLGLENSFFGLPLVCNSKYPNFIHYIYPMYWNNRSNIIQIKKSICNLFSDRGKTSVDGDFNGFIYCLDYYLIYMNIYM